MKVIIVQSRPYQAFAGGDGAYTDALVQHLEQVGCTVRGLTSGTTKGRPRAWLKLAYSGTRGAPWKFRSALRVGRFYLTFGPQLVRDAAAFVGVRFRRSGETISPFAIPPSRTELTWITREIARERPNLVILSFEAAGAIDVVRAQQVPALALVGFLPLRSYALTNAQTAEQGGADLEHYSLDVARRADWIAFSSRDDCNFARTKLGIAEPMYIGMGVEQKRKQTDGQDPLLLFVGNKTEPNREAVAWFLRDVWPIVRGQLPTAGFRIVGRVGHYFRSDANAGVECAGEVASLAGEYCAARLVVAPLMTGSAGVKTKVAEAISYGCPIVATSLGVDAADVGQIDPAGYIADDAATFAARTLDLLTDDELWRSKQEGTRIVFDKLFSRNSAYRELNRVLAALGHSGVETNTAEGSGAFGTASHKS